MIWKGAVLIDAFYPDPGVRKMSDLDFALPLSEMGEASAAFRSVGFEEADPGDPGAPAGPRAGLLGDATSFRNRAGLFCDVHHRVRLFEGKEGLGLTVDLRPNRVEGPGLTTLEPNAFLAHLIVHLDGHRGEEGCPLCGSWTSSSS